MFASKNEAAASSVRPARGLQLVMWVALLAVGGTVALSSWAQPAGSESGVPPRHAMHHGPRGGDVGFGGHRLFMGSPEHVDRSVDRFLKGIDATEAQRTQIKQIVRTAAAELKPIHEAVRALRTQGQQLFTAPTVDARAVEAVRAQLVAQHDQASKRISQAMLDISRVLTPEQRGKLAQQLQQRQERMKEHMKERRQNRSTEHHGAASAPAR
jgi:protein CpxP